MATTTNSIETKLEQSFSLSDTITGQAVTIIQNTLQQELNDGLKAFELFTCFTANIIKEKTLFTR